MTIPAHIERLGGRFFKKPARSVESADVSARVKEMLTAIRQDGIEAARRYSRELDKWSPDSFRCSEQQIEASVQSLDQSLRSSLTFALGNIRRFAGEQLRLLQDLDIEVLPGVRLGHRFKPIRNVGAYVPGGRYPLIASAFMTIATAKVASVPRVVAAAPPDPRKGGIDPVQLAAMHWPERTRSMRLEVFRPWRRFP